MFVIDQGEILRFLRVVDLFTAPLAEGLTHHSGVSDLRDNSEARALLFIICLLASFRSSLTNFLKQAASIIDSWSCSLFIYILQVSISLNISPNITMFLTSKAINHYGCN